MNILLNGFSRCLLVSCQSFFNFLWYMTTTKTYLTYYCLLFNSYFFASYFCSVFPRVPRRSLRYNLSPNGPGSFLSVFVRRWTELSRNVKTQARSSGTLKDIMEHGTVRDSHIHYAACYVRARIM